MRIELIPLRINIDRNEQMLLKETCLNQNETKGKRSLALGTNNELLVKANKAVKVV